MGFNFATIYASIIYDPQVAIGWGYQWYNSGTAAVQIDMIFAKNNIDRRLVRYE